jgi:hypothetical protein
MLVVGQEATVAETEAQRRMEIKGTERQKA